MWKKYWTVNFWGTAGLISTRIHQKCQWVKGKKFCSNCSILLTKVADIPVYIKKTSKSLHLEHWNRFFNNHLHRKLKILGSCVCLFVYLGVLRWAIQDYMVLWFVLIRCCIIFASTLECFVTFILILLCDSSIIHYHPDSSLGSISSSVEGDPGFILDCSVPKSL